MACGGCEAQIRELTVLVGDLRTALDALREEYLALARDFDEATQDVNDQDEDE